MRYVSSTNLLQATTALHEIPVVIMSSENIPKRIKR
jgi:hypothetical protein